MHVIPGQTLPELKARLIGGDAWSLAGEKPGRLALLAFYRGIFCPVCRTWLADLDRLVPELEKRGVSAIALSCDPRESAGKSVTDWAIRNLRIGCELDPEGARKAGVYISRGRGVNPGSGLKETRLFTEPAVLLARRGGERPGFNLYAAWIQSTPYARPHPAEILAAVDNFIARDLPEPRGSA